MNKEGKILNVETEFLNRGRISVKTMRLLGSLTCSHFELFIESEGDKQRSRDAVFHPTSQPQMAGGPPLTEPFPLAPTKGRQGEWFLSSALGSEGLGRQARQRRPHCPDSLGISSTNLRDNSSH